MYASSSPKSEKKFSIPCKYFLSGLCQKGVKCRFLHIHPEEHFKYRKSIPGIRRFQREMLNDQSRYFLQRRPLLHLIVLFASDVRVKQYADDLVRRYTRDGINCYLQTHTDEKKFIKPENLVKLIGTSTADYLVVIGDRNMKNQTIQARKNGKLVPVAVHEEKKFIIQEWSKRKRKDYLDHADSLSTNQTLSLFSDLIGQPNLHKRYQNLFDVIKTYGRNKRFIPKQNFEELIFLHAHCHLGLELVQNIPIDDRYGGDSQTGLNLTLFAEQNKQIGISSRLKSRLLKFGKNLFAKVKKLGPRLSQLHNQKQSDLWAQYQDEFEKNPTSARSEFVIAPVDHNSVDGDFVQNETKSWANLVSSSPEHPPRDRLRSSSRPMDIGARTNAWQQDTLQSGIFKSDSDSLFKSEDPFKSESSSLSLSGSLGSSNSFSPPTSASTSPRYGSRSPQFPHASPQQGSMYSSQVGSPDVSWSVASTTSSLFDPWDLSDLIQPLNKPNKSEIRNDFSQGNANQSIMLPNDLWDDCDKFDDGHHNGTNPQSGIFQMDDNAAWDNMNMNMFHSSPYKKPLPHASPLQGSNQSPPQRQRMTNHPSMTPPQAQQRLSFNSPAFMPVKQIGPSYTYPHVQHHQGYYGM